MELAEAPGYERQKLAETFWYLYHDLSKEAREQGHLSSINEVSGKGFPDVTAGLADLLKEKEFRTRLTSEFLGYRRCQNAITHVLYGGNTLLAHEGRCRQDL